MIKKTFAFVGKLIKDLLYTKDNGGLDIVRVSVLGSIIAFWVGLFLIPGFDPVAVGTGSAALFAGAAAWMFQRDNVVDRNAYDPNAPRGGHNNA